MEYIDQIGWDIGRGAILGENSVLQNFYNNQHTYHSSKYLGFNGKTIQTELPWSTRTCLVYSTNFYRQE